jgi:hypothetical protein
MYCFYLKMYLHSVSVSHVIMQIVDRPTQSHVFLSREYVQPQWVFDCVNARIILPTERHLVGRYVAGCVIYLSYYKIWIPC